MTEYEEWTCTKCCSVPCYCKMELGQEPTHCLQPLEYDSSAEWRRTKHETKKQNTQSDMP